MVDSLQVASGNLGDFFRYSTSSADAQYRADIESAFANKKRGNILMGVAPHDPTKMLVFTNRELWVRFGTASLETQKKLLHVACNMMALTGTNAAEINELPWNPSGTIKKVLTIMKLGENCLTLALK